MISFFGFRLARGEEKLVPADTTGLWAALKLYADSEFSWKIGERQIVDSLVGKRFSYTLQLMPCRNRLLKIQRIGIGQALAQVPSSMSFVCFFPDPVDLAKAIFI